MTVWGVARARGAGGRGGGAGGGGAGALARGRARRITPLVGALQVAGLVLEVLERGARGELAGHGANPFPSCPWSAERAGRDDHARRSGLSFGWASALSADPEAPRVRR